MSYFANNNRAYYNTFYLTIHTCNTKRIFKLVEYLKTQKKYACNIAMQ